MAGPRPRLSVAQILRWADGHHRRTGDWPGAHSGPVRGAPGEVWRGIDAALRHGWRGLPGGDSLSQLLVRSGRRRATRAGHPIKPWTAEEDALLRVLSPAEAARRTGRPLQSIYARRHRLRLPDARKQYR